MRLFGLILLFLLIGLIVGYLIFGRISGKYIPIGEILKPQNDTLTNFGNSLKQAAGIDNIEDSRKNIIISGAVGVVIGMFFGIMKISRNKS